MSFKVISLNIWQGGMRFDKIVKFLKNEDADIVTLQEVFSGNRENLARRFKTVIEFKQFFKNYKFVFSADQFQVIGLDKIDRGNLVFSKLKILSHKTYFYNAPYGEVNEKTTKDFSNNPRNLQYVQIQQNESVINLYNTHGVWGFDNSDTNRRLHMAKFIIDKVKNKKNVILCGDFNVDWKSKTISIIEKRLINVFKNELKTSFNLTIKKRGKFKSSVVDMIFISKDFKVVNRNCPKIDISDHLPLIVKLKLL